MYSEVQQLSKSNISDGWLDYCHPTLCMAMLLPGPGRSGFLQTQQKAAFTRLLLKRTAPDTRLPHPSNGTQGKSSLLKDNICRSYRYYTKFREVHVRLCVIFIGGIGHNWKSALAPRFRNWGKPELHTELGKGCTESWAYTQNCFYLEIFLTNHRKNWFVLHNFIFIFTVKKKLSPWTLVKNVINYLPQSKVRESKCLHLSV